MIEKTDYYTDRVGALLQRFARVARYYRPALAAHFADGSPDTTIREIRREFKRLLPFIPYIGGKKNSLTRILIHCTMYLALYRILKGRGASVQEIGHIMVEIEERQINAYPRNLVRLAGWYFHTPLGRCRVQQMMVEHSQKHAYPGGWKATFIESDGQTFDFGIDYSECALVKFFEQQGASEFTRYLCLIEYIQQRVMDTGFFRTMTLAEGGERCDFRWKKGKETRPAWPPPWAE